MGKRARRRRTEVASRRTDPEVARPEPVPSASSGHVEVSVHSGPLPTPADLEAYDQVVPGTAELIVDGFVQQGTHRRKLENRDSKAKAFSLYALTIMWVVTNLAPLAAGVYLITQGSLWVGAVLALGGGGWLVRLGYVGRQD